MILSTVEMMDVLEPALAIKLKAEVEVVAFTHMRIYFYFKAGSAWFEGYVKVNYDTDLAIYLHNGNGYSYFGDINWCDILPEGVE